MRLVVHTLCLTVTVWSMLPGCALDDDDDSGSAADDDATDVGFGGLDLDGNGVLGPEDLAPGQGAAFLTANFGDQKAPEEFVLGTSGISVRGDWSLLGQLVLAAEDAEDETWPLALSFEEPAPTEGAVGRTTISAPGRWSAISGGEGGGRIALTERTEDLTSGYLSAPTTLQAAVEGKAEFTGTVVLRGFAFHDSPWIP